MRRRIERVPIDHVKLPVGDLDASRAFYSAALAPFGYKLVYDEEPSLGFGLGDGSDEDEPFALERTGSPSVCSHVAFTASSTAQVDAFHAAALAAGGRDDGPPGERPYGAYYYAAFVLDPDGHNIEAVYTADPRSVTRAATAISARAARRLPSGGRPSRPSRRSRVCA
jgi:catechol 2,3-dioxygenase-like lactoylglutathione lyase family enzyme